MKIFIDTNIFLDLILKREYSKEATIILNAVSENMFTGIVLDITLLNIDYIAKKQVVDIRKFIGTINNLFNVVGANNDIFKGAIEIENRDLEDNIQYLVAQKSHCDVIVTNDKNFYQGNINLLSSSAFIAEYLEG